MIIFELFASEIPYYVKLSPRSWSDAKQACIDYGTQLATIYDGADNPKAQEACSDGNAGTHVHCWIGLTSEGQCEWCFYWLRDPPSTHYNWDSSTSHNNPAKRCVYIVDTTAKWVDADCNLINWVLCMPLTPSPTTSPSKTPTKAPTTLTLQPTNAPSFSPSFSPTNAGENCEDRGYIYHHNWDNTSIAQKPYFDYNIEINPNDLSISVQVNLEYIGYSTAESVNGLGSTYVLDFEAFDVFNHHINEPGSCSNRLYSSFINKTFGEYWLYSNTPYQSGHIASDNYLAYPPYGNGWVLSMDSSNPWIECSRIKYEATFSWNELSGCTDYEGNKLIDINIDPNWITLSGRFYINLVSPKSNTQELNVYFSKSLMEPLPFTMKVSRSVHTISSTEIELFLITIYQAIRLFVSSTDSSDGSFVIRISTQIADYMQLTSPLIITSPQYPWQIDNINNGDCIFERTSICTQYWEISSGNVPCPISFSGLFHLYFTAICNPIINDTQACNDYIAAYNDSVELQFDLSHTDIINCTDSGIIDYIQFNGVMQFYTDSVFTDMTDNNDKYRSGIDIIYGEIVTDIPNNSLSVFEASLLNIWICSIDPVYSGTIEIDQKNALFSGCHNSSIVDEGSTIQVMLNQVSQLNFDVMLINTDTLTNTVRYSFLAPSWAARDVLYIHCEVQISLINQGSRRRLVAGGHDFGDIQHIVHVIEPVNIDNDNNNNNTDLDKHKSNNINLLIWICVATVFVIIALIVTVYYYHSYKTKRNKNDVNDIVDVAVDRMDEGVEEYKPDITTTNISNIDTNQIMQITANRSMNEENSDVNIDEIMNDLVSLPKYLNNSL